MTIKLRRMIIAASATARCAPARCRADQALADLAAGRVTGAAVLVVNG